MLDEIINYVQSLQRQVEVIPIRLLVRFKLFTLFHNHFFKITTGFRIFLNYIFIIDLIMAVLVNEVIFSEHQAGV